MNKAKSYKLALIVVCFLMAMIAAIGFVSVSSVRVYAASSIDSPTNYFDGTVSFEDDKVVSSVSSGDSISFKNDLVINNAALELTVPENLTELKITLTSASFYTAGAVKEGDLDTSIDNVVTLKAGELSLNEVSAEGSALVQGDVKVEFKVTDNVLSVSVGDITVVNTDDYYRIGGKDKVPATIKIEFTVEGSNPVTFGIKAVDQNVGVDGYRQTFELENGKVKEIAKPRVSISDTLFTGSSNDINVLKGNMYTLSFKAYSVFGTSAYTNSSFYLKVSAEDADKVWLQNSSTPKSISFDEDVTFTITNGTVDAETYAVTVKEKKDDTTAPRYVATDFAIDSYKVAVEKAAEEDYGADGVKSVRLGGTFNIPSMESFVIDDLTTYENLKKTVYYKTPSNASGSSTSMKITLSEAGDYEFFVVFADQAGNTMDKDDFYTEGEDDANVVVYGDYGAYVFNFHIEDDAPILVTANSEKQADGYLNTKYTATAFTVKASGNTTTYTLKYNPSLTATEDSEGWVVIPKKSEVKEGYDENGFTYEDISAIDYDGSLTFTPVKMGNYMIECTVTSNNSVRSSSATEIITVNREPSVVKVPSTWLKDNVWSVVFLAIGTLSLIGIIVLLFIKPKQETEKDETGDAYKNAKNN